MNEMREQIIAVVNGRNSLTYHKLWAFLTHDFSRKGYIHKKLILTQTTINFNKQNLFS